MRASGTSTMPCGDLDRVSGVVALPFLAMTWTRFFVLLQCSAGLLAPDFVRAVLADSGLKAT
jgi:hypothetical protein